MLPFSQMFAVSCAPGTFFGIPAWYQYLYKAQQIKANSAGVCSAVHFTSNTSLGTDLSLIGLGILDMVLRVAGIAAVAYVIYGGIQYVTSQGEPDKTKHAQGTIINAFIGLIIAIVATGFVTFLGNKLAG